MNAPTSPDVLIVSYRRADLLERCLASVRTYLPASSVYVWDNRSDGSDDVRVVAAAHAEICWTFHDENIGFAAAVNRLVAMSDADTFLLLNPDAQLVGDLAASREALRTPTVAAAAPWVEDEDHRPWDNAHREPTLARQLVNYAGWEDRVGRLPALSMAYQQQPHEVDGYLTGAGLLISRDAWRAVGEFDERYFLYGEEADWCRRARLRGYTLCAVAEKGVVHRAAGTVSDAVTAMSRSNLLLQENRVRYMRLHHGPLAARSFQAGSALLDRVQTSKRRQRQNAAPDFIITSPTLDFGGAERQRVALANGLAEHGERVTLRLLQGEGGLREDVSPAVQVESASYRHITRNAGRHTLLVTGTTRIEVAFGAAWRAVNAPNGRWIVANHHAAAPDHAVFHGADAALMRASDGVVYLADIHRDAHLAHQRLDRGRYWVVPNGIDVSNFTPARGDATRAPAVVTIGRLAEIKQIPLLVEAMSDLSDLDWTLDIWGDGPDRDRIEAAVPAHLSDRICLRGWCTDVAAVLADADLFCTTSRFEAQPMTILEAMAAGVPVASSAVASVPEMLSDGAGVLVEPNTREEWSRRLRTLLTDPAQLEALGRAGRTRALERYTESRMIENYRRIRDEVTAR